jgi:prepilin-type N-terminal cleavage/methylation domain-containing protein
MAYESLGEDGMAFRRPKTRAAVTLIEVMAAIIIVSVAPVQHFLSGATMG